MNIDYLTHVMIIVALYGIMGIGFSLLLGRGQLFAACPAAFAGVGAYGVTVFSGQGGLSLLGGLLLGTLVAMLAGLAIAIPSLRVHHDYFIVASLAFQLLMFELANNWVGVTGGGAGISIPPASVLGVELVSAPLFLPLVIILSAFAVWLVHQIDTSGFGAVVRAVGEDELGAKSGGHNPLWVKLRIFAIASGLIGAAGGLFAKYVGYINPNNFDVQGTFLIVIVALLGGTLSKWGPLIGAVLVFGLPELLRFVGVLGTAAGPMRQILFGLVFLLIVYVRPQGLMGDRRQGLTVG